MEVFCNHLEEEAKRLYCMFSENLMEPLTSEEWREFNGAHLLRMLQAVG